MTHPQRRKAERSQQGCRALTAGTERQAIQPAPGFPFPQRGKGNGKGKGESLPTRTAHRATHKLTEGMAQRAAAREQRKPPGARSPQPPSGGTPPGVEPTGPEARRDGPGGHRRPGQGTGTRTERGKGDHPRREPADPGGRGQGTARGLPTTERVSAHTGGSFQAGGMARGPVPAWALCAGPAPHSGRRARRANADPPRGRGPGASGDAVCAKRGPDQPPKAARDPAAHFLLGMGRAHPGRDAPDA